MDVRHMNAFDGLTESVKASELTAGSAVVDALATPIGEEDRRRYRIRVLLTDAGWDENRVRGVVGARCIDTSDVGSPSREGDSYDTEWFATEYVTVLTGEGRTKFGVPSAPVALEPYGNARHRCVPCSLAGVVVGATHQAAYADGNWPVKVCGACANVHTARGAQVWAWTPEV